MIPPDTYSCWRWNTAERFNVNDVDNLIDETKDLVGLYTELQHKEEVIDTETGEVIAE